MTFKRVEVKWLDSVHDTGWQSLKGSIQEATNECEKHSSIGYLLDKTKDHVLIAMNRNEEGTMVSETMQFPSKVVISIKELK